MISCWTWRRPHPVFLGVTVDLDLVVLPVLGQVLLLAVFGRRHGDLLGTQISGDATGEDEEDDQQEDDVDHRRQIDVDIAPVPTFVYVPYGLSLPVGPLHAGPYKCRRSWRRQGSRTQLGAEVVQHLTGQDTGFEDARLTRARRKKKKNIIGMAMIRPVAVVIMAPPMSPRQGTWIWTTTLRTPSS